MTQSVLHTKIPPHVQSNGHIYAEYVKMISPLTGIMTSPYDGNLGTDYKQHETNINNNKKFKKKDRDFHS